MNEAIAPHPPTGGVVASDPDSTDQALETRRAATHPLVSLLHRAAGDTPGIDVVYEALDLVAEHFHLEDAIVLVRSEALGPQAFRLGRRPVGRAELGPLRGGADFVSTPDSVPQPMQRLVAGISEVALATHLARRHLVRDRTTGLLSRAVFNEALRSAAAQSSRYGWIFTVMVLRVPGAPASEGETRRLGYAFGRALRTGDSGGRLRGTTFTALLPNATADALHALVRRFSEESGVPADSLEFASATAPKDSIDPAELFRLAASRLHEA